MQYEIIITPSAKADIFEINVWFLENNFEFAEKWIQGLGNKIVSLSKLPKRCSISPESEAFDVEVRQLFYGSKPNMHRILFSIHDEKVFILRVRSTKQQSLLDQ